MCHRAQVLSQTRITSYNVCYTKLLRVLQAALQAQAKALYLFPTKALAQDQVAELAALNEAGGLGVRAFTFDGDIV